MMPFSPQPKPRPRALDRIVQRTTADRRDAQVRAACRARAEGRCEVRIARQGRCRRAPVDNHHLIAGRGRRNVGSSALARWRLAVCRRCHDLITQHLLEPVDPLADATRVRFRRVTP